MHNALQSGHALSTFFDKLGPLLVEFLFPHVAHVFYITLASGAGGGTGAKENGGVVGEHDEEFGNFGYIDQQLFVDLGNKVCQTRIFFCPSIVISGYIDILIAILFIAIAFTIVINIINMADFGILSWYFLMVDYL